MNVKKTGQAKVVAEGKPSEKKMTVGKDAKVSAMSQKGKSSPSVVKKTLKPLA